jgi:hypothetical protein
MVTLKLAGLLQFNDHFLKAELVSDLPFISRIFLYILEAS